MSSVWARGSSCRLCGRGAPHVVCVGAGLLMSSVWARGSSCRLCGRGAPHVVWARGSSCRLCGRGAPHVVCVGAGLLMSSVWARGSSCRLCGRGAPHVVCVGAGLLVSSVWVRGSSRCVVRGSSCRLCGVGLIAMCGCGAPHVVCVGAGLLMSPVWCGAPHVGVRGSSCRLCGAGLLMSSVWCGAPHVVCVVRGSSCRLCGAGLLMSSVWCGAPRVVCVVRGSSRRLCGCGAPHVVCVGAGLLMSSVWVRGSSCRLCGCGAPHVVCVGAGILMSSVWVRGSSCRLCGCGAPHVVCVGAGLLMSSVWVRGSSCRLCGCGAPHVVCVGAGLLMSSVWVRGSSCRLCGCGAPHVVCVGAGLLMSSVWVRGSSCRLCGCGDPHVVCVGAGLLMSSVWVRGSSCRLCGCGAPHVVCVGAGLLMSSVWVRGSSCRLCGCGAPHVVCVGAGLLMSSVWVRGSSCRLCGCGAPHVVCVGAGILMSSVWVRGSSCGGAGLLMSSVWCGAPHVVCVVRGPHVGVRGSSCLGAGLLMSSVWCGAPMCTVFSWMLCLFQTSVIVNSISSDLDLTRGAISSAIYSRAGPKLQEEVWRKGHSFSNMISTRGPNLPCHFVYHVILATGETNVEKTLQEVTKKCLMTAHTHKSSSISFPALGTGNMGLQKHKVADIMTQAVLDFARLHQSSMEVNFVIHPLDVETFQAFLDKFKASRITNVKNMEFTKNPKGPEPSDEGMCVTISGECGEDVAEAAAWLQGVLSPSPTPLLLHNNLLLLFGSEEIDALASCPASVEMEEDLRDGRVTLKISGPLPDRIVAAVQVERLLLDVQNELAQSLEAELLEAAVTWFYESPSESHRYPAKANRELEKAFASRRNFVLSAPPGHVINFDNDTAMERERKYTLRRRCLRDSFQNIQTSPLPSLEVERSSPEFREQSTEFRKAGLILQKMEKVQNELLFRVFQSKKDAARARRSETLYQLVPRQFCRDICDVGFHRVYGTPRDTRYGSGVYFKKSLPNITQRFQCPEKDGLLCVLQAEVLAGDFTKYARNQPSLPCIGSDALQVYEGLVDGGMPAEHYVIFDLFPSQSPVCVHLQT
ncbi:protein mono-ADP-ribosyltransferase PARP9 isoform X1 [Bufo gargarizans]|uniref:protein mono-ADP-ribosyltransferase PARP9 isoform X1 n=1 Tax=Bufo gargarizans TaxID=30331 RepID=UPI001CF1AB72|nr:protein mono-ADP-ribosyltransferase PARP9 isoform X1 [Bufo gargarizans]